MRAIVAGAFLLLAGFHQPASFEASVNDGGGNRVYFDGSPRQKAYDCSACHTPIAGQITAKLDITPPVNGAYQPGTTYTIAVSLVGEHLGFGTANNQNGFVAELVDDTGVTAGTLVSPDIDRVTLIDDGGVVAGEGKDIAMWSFMWTAPAAGRGAIALHLAMVDGNGAANAMVPQNDPGGDDVATANLRMCEDTPGCVDPITPALAASKATGCSTAGGASPWLVLLALLALRHRRALFALMIAGCFSASTPADCPDHVCGGTGGDDGGSTCKENWVCTSWAAPAGSDQATRSCVDQNMVGTNECRPATTATLPALDLDYYKCNVHPIFQRGCGQLACHGTDTAHAFRIYSRGRWRNDQQVQAVTTCLDTGQIVNLQMMGTATVMCEGWLPHTTEEWKKSFDSSRSFMLDVTNPDDSLLLREPAKGGLPHAQVKLFAQGDGDYQTIHNWLGGAKLGSTCNTGRN